MIIPFTFFPLVRTTTLDLSIGKIYIYIFTENDPEETALNPKKNENPTASIRSIINFSFPWFCRRNTQEQYTRRFINLFTHTRHDTDTRTHIHAYKHKRTIYKELENRETVRFHARSLYLYEP